MKLADLKIQLDRVNNRMAANAKSRSAKVAAAETSAANRNPEFVFASNFFYNFKFLKSQICKSESYMEFFNDFLHLTKIIGAIATRRAIVSVQMSSWRPRGRALGRYFQSRRESCQSYSNQSRTL